MGLPGAEIFLAPIYPFINFYYETPFASLVLFLALYVGVIRNLEGFSRFVRVNALQAVMLDICLIVPGLIDASIDAGGGAAARASPLFAQYQNTVWLFVVACFAASAVSCI